jgi:hypothetical protein
MATKEIRYAIRGTSDTEKVTKKSQADMGVLDQTFHKFQYKLKNVGNQIAKSLFHMIGPLALAHMAFSKVEGVIEEYKQKIKDAVDAGAKLGNQARDTNMTVEQYQKVSEATSQMGFQIEDVAGAYKTAKKAIIEARDSTSRYHEVLTRLGFSSKDLVDGKVNEDQVLMALSNAINTTTDDTRQAAIATAAFGAEGEKMVKILREWVELQKKISEAKSITSPFAKILADKASQESFNKKKDEVEIQRRKATEAYITGEAGPIDPRVKEAVDKMISDIEKAAAVTGDATSVPANLLAANQGIQDIVEKVVSESMGKAAVEKIVTSPEAQKAATDLITMGKETPLKAESFSVQSGFSNVVGVGANPVSEVLNQQLEESRKHTMLLQAIAAKSDTFKTPDITKECIPSPNFDEQGYGDQM